MLSGQFFDQLNEPVSPASSEPRTDTVVGDVEGLSNGGKLQPQKVFRWRESLKNLPPRAWKVPCVVDCPDSLRKSMAGHPLKATRLILKALTRITDGRQLKREFPTKSELRKLTSKERP